MLDPVRWNRSTPAGEVCEAAAARTRRNEFHASDHAMPKRLVLSTPQELARAAATFQRFIGLPILLEPAGELSGPQDRRLEADPTTIQPMTDDCRHDWIERAADEPGRFWYSCLNCGLAAEVIQ